MKTLEIARKLAEAGEKEEASKAYELVLQENNGNNNDIDLEAAVYLLYQEVDYRIPVTTLVNLHKKDYMKTDIVALLFSILWQPNFSIYKENYRKNIAKLKNYKYIFKKSSSFPNFEDLNILFLPFGKDAFIPYNQEKDEFGEICKIRHEEITHYFFKDLSKPIYVKDIYSQYELEYLFDQIRESEHCGKENHIYLYYSNTEKFMSFLQILDMKYLTRREKYIFLFDEYENKYPIDFKKEYGIDYSKFTPKEIKPEEITKLIYHQQYSSHNGGDFFNEIFDAHPYICSSTSRMYTNYLELYAEYKKIESGTEITGTFSGDKNFKIFKKDTFKTEEEEAHYFLTSILLKSNIEYLGSYAESRIIPAAFIQPHFSNIFSKLTTINKNTIMISNNEHESILSSILLKNFKYIKTFAPIRKPVRSFGATMKFFMNDTFNPVDDKLILANQIMYILKNKNYLFDPFNRYYNDSRLVKFEDAKIYPKDIFHKLASFLDIPYTDTMNYCSEFCKVNPEALEGNDIGFSKAAIYRTYEDYIGKKEGLLLEYMLKDFYEKYNYDYDYYNKKDLNKEQLLELADNLDKYYSTVRKYSEDEYSDTNKTRTIYSGDKIYFGPKKDKTRGETLEGCYKIEIRKYIENYYENNFNYLSPDKNQMNYIPLISK